MTPHTIDTQAALRRTAILLSTLSAETSRLMLSNLAPLKRAMLKRAMNELTDVDPLERRQAMQQFLNSASAPPAASGPTGQASTTGTNAAADPSPATTPLSFLGSVPDHVLLAAIQEEHPQTIAIVLASIQPPQAARLLPRLSDPTRNAAVQRLARLEQLPPDALDSIGEHLKKLVAEAMPSAASATGSRTLHAILDQVPGELRQSMTHLLGWPEQPPAADTLPPAEPSLRLAPESVPPSSREFDDDEPGDFRTLTIDAAVLDQQFLQLRPTELRDGLAQLDGQQALLAVCGLPARVADRVLGTLPRRQARQIRQQLQSLDSVTLEDIDRAKQELAELLGILPNSASAGSQRTPSRQLSAAA